MNAAIHAFRTDEDNVLLSPWLAHVERTPSAIAVSGAYGTVRYDGLHAVVCSFAAGLDRHGIGPDDIVAFAADHSPESIALMLAIAANGAAWLPLVPEAADPRLAELVAEAQPQLVIGDP